MTAPELHPPLDAVGPHLDRGFTGELGSATLSGVVPPERAAFTMRVQAFQRYIRFWFRRHGRHGLPWRTTRDPYHILVSEVMLQQTQVSRVIPKYREFLGVFPTIRALDRATLAGVLRVWQGLGYNRRAVSLKRIARILARDCGGEVPDDPADLERLPGVGRATAGAVAVFAYGRRVAFLETNIRRLFIHRFFSDRRRVRDAEVLAVVRQTLPQRNLREWYYALMDYGALALGGIENPNRRSAHYVRQSPFRGSRRELRGRILAEVLRAGELLAAELRRRIAPHETRRRCAGAVAFRTVLGELVADGLIAARGRRIGAPASHRTP